MKLTLAILAALVTLPAAAREPCMDRTTLVERLADTYGESQVSWGLATGQIIEVWASPSGSWTVMRSLPGGVSCIVATGQHWQAVEAVDGEAL